VLNEQIPLQYDRAVRADADIKTVVMTGGGNDVLLGSGCTGDCKDVIDRVAVRMAALRAQMAEDGVEDVILISYGYPRDPARKPALDYSRQLIPTQCLKTNKPRCHFIDPINELQGKIATDGIHPTAEGYDILGRMVWELMQAEGMRR
jgi:lysophospholipase L1-like esterase